MTRRDHDYAASGGAGAGTNGMGGKGGGPQPVSPLEELMRRKGVDDAWSALEEMQKQGLTSDRFTISRMLMKTVGDGRNRLHPAKVYRGIALVERFIQYQPEEADEVLFNALLDTCCRIKDLCRLEATVERMRELQIPPSHVTLGILVKAYGQAGDITRVLKVWDDMGDQRRQANAVTFGCMIDACVKCGQMQKAMEIFYDMKRRRKHRNTILYTTLIKGCGLDKDLRTALALFREMREEGVPYNTITYNSIIDVCIKCNDVSSAEELLREMLAPGNNVEPDLITYSTLLKGYCHLGDLDKALQVAETIKACGLKCDELVYNTLMDGCVKANDLSAGIGLFAEMTQAGMKPSSITHSILVRLYQRNGYKGDCFDAVALLYQHHGLERPNGVMERGGKGGNGGGRRGDRSRNGQQNNYNNQNGYRDPAGGGGGGQLDAAAVDGGIGAGWDQGGGAPPGMPPQGFPGPLHMPPSMAGGYGASPMLGPDQAGLGELDALAAQTAQGGFGGVPYGMPSMDAAARGGCGMYMPPSPARGMSLGGPPGMLSWPWGMTGPASQGAVPPQLYAGAPGAAAPGPLGTDPRRFPPGRIADDGLDASRVGVPLLDPSLPPWAGGGGMFDMPHAGAMPPKAYFDRMTAGMVDTGSPLGVQCGGPATFGEY